MSIYFFYFFTISNYINNNIIIGTNTKGRRLRARSAHSGQEKIKFLFDAMPALC